MSNNLKNMSYSRRHKIVGLPERKLEDDLITACQRSQSKPLTFIS